jgi:4-hydroxybenzoate polyprenyltransferase
MLSKIAEISKFFTSNALLLAFDGPLVVFFGYMLYGITANFTILLASFLGVFSIYTLNKATDKKEDRVNRPDQPSRSTTYYVAVSLVTMISSLILGASVSLFAFLILLTPTMVGVLYSVRVSPRLPRLKEIVGAKSLLVAFSWSLYGAFLPLALNSSDFPNIALVFTYIFAQVIINTILFDFFDTKGDRESGIKTLPIVFGTEKTKKMLFFINSSLATLITFCEIEGYFLKVLPALFFGVVYGYFIIWHFVREPINRLNAELMIDGAWFPLVTFVKLILR